MRCLFIAPSKIDDEHVHELAVRRAHLMENAIIKEDVHVTREELLKDETENHLIYASEKIQAIRIYSNEYESENSVLDGSWRGLRKFHDRILPNLRKKMNSCRRQAEGDCITFIDLGQSLFCLYAAYFSVMDGFDTNVVFHNPKEGEPFTIGGMSVYARFRALLRRSLGVKILQKADNVFVDHENVIAALTQLFPTCKREILPDPVSDFSLPEPKAPLLPEGV